MTGNSVSEGSWEVTDNYTITSRLAIRNKTGKYLYNCCINVSTMIYINERGGLKLSNYDFLAIRFAQAIKGAI